MLIRKERRERGRAGELLFALLYMILIGSVLVAGGMWGRGRGLFVFSIMAQLHSHFNPQRFCVALCLDERHY